MYFDALSIQSSYAQYTDPAARLSEVPAAVAHLFKDTVDEKIPVKEYLSKQSKIRVGKGGTPTAYLVVKESGDNLKPHRLSLKEKGFVITGRLFEGAWLAQTNAEGLDEASRHL